MKVKRILVIPELSGSMPNACAYIRLLYPLATLMKNSNLSIIDVSKFLFQNNSKLDIDLSEISAITTQRTAPLQSSGAWEILKLAKKKGIPIHWDLDDFPIQLQLSSHETDYLSLLSKSLIEMRSIADLVTLSTPALQQQLEALIPTSQVYRNSIADGLWCPSDLEKNESILFFGLGGHKSGLESISEKLYKRNLKQLKAMNFKIEAVGQLNGTYHPLINVTEVPSGATSYPRFANWLSRWNRSTIGLVYHQVSPLNHGKSAIKALEYGALGVATISNLNQAILDDPVREYARVVSDDDFLDEMLQLFEDKVSQDLMSKNVNTYVLKERLLSNDLLCMTAFYSKFVDSLK